MTTYIVSQTNQDYSFDEGASGELDSSACAAHFKKAIAANLATEIADCTRLSGLEAIAAAQFIQKLHYWTDKKYGVVADGIRWIYNNYWEWIEQNFPISIYVFRKIKNVLQDLGLILVQKLRSRQWNQTYHYALNYDKLQEFCSLKPLKSPNVKTVNDQRSTPLMIEDATVELSYTNKQNNINKQKKQIKKKISSKKKTSETELAYEVSGVSMKGSESPNNSVLETNIPQVDEKINTNKNTMQSDRHFPLPNKQSEIRGRVKYNSVLGFSGFNRIEELQDCQKQLTVYFAKKLDASTAAEKASWIIKGEKQGERSPYVQDYLDGLPIGSWCVKEWEIEPGIIKPVFASYLRHKLYKDKDTREQVNVKVHWYLKDKAIASDAWGECKRLIGIEKPRLIEAMQRGQNLTALKIPDWIVEAFKEEVRIEEITGTAEALGAIAVDYNQQIKEVQNVISSADEEIPELPPKHPIRQLLNKFNILEPMPVARKTSYEIEIEKEEFISEEEYSDPLNSDGSFSPSPERGAKNFYQEGHNDAHKLYMPETIEKGSKEAWEKAVSKCKFLKMRRKKT